MPCKGMNDDEIVPTGVKRLGDITISGHFVGPNDPTPGSTCKAEPCSVCGGCSVCMDFHGNAYGACKEDTCPRQKRNQ